MEKLIYLLWKNPAQPVSAWREQLCGELGQCLLRSGALSMQLSLVDDAVAAGAALRIISRPAPDGFVALWVDSANDRADLERLLGDTHARLAGYLVTESCVKNGAGYRQAGQRSTGFSLIGFLQRPPRLSESDWLHLWLGNHTRVAVDTQSTFRYVQNVVTRRLTIDAPPLDALVEEGFPLAALTSNAAFYDAEGDDGKYQRNLQAMMESCHRFIDFDRLDSMPMSEYLVQAEPADNH